MKRLSTLFLIVSHLSYAGTMGLVSTPAQYYIKIGSGGSYSLNSYIYADPIY
jgi:hypothetical protein